MNFVVFRYATILAFDVKIEKEAQEMADSLGVKIFQADIIYHLFDKFMAYREELKQKKREEFRSIAVFPCKLKVRHTFTRSHNISIKTKAQIDRFVFLANIKTNECTIERKNLMPWIRKSFGEIFLQTVNSSVSRCRNCGIWGSAKNYLNYALTSCQIKYFRYIS